MKYLKQIDANLEDGSFKATFWNDKTTENKTVADFFMVMMDRNATIEEVKSHINLGKQLDLTKPWNEIEEIIK